jgi:hypothetical protein
MKKIILSIALLILLISSKGQNIGIGTTTPHASAALEIKDSARGILIPRLTTQQRASINSPAEGLMVYQIDGAKGFWYYDGAIWKNVSASSNSAGAGSDAQTLIFTTTGF